MIHFKNLSKIYKTSYGDVEALKNIELVLPKTGMIFIVGKSGSGKTTMLNILGGLDKYEKGDLVVLGKSTKHFTDQEFDNYRNSVVGFVFQDYNLLDNFTIAENIKLATDLQATKTTKVDIEKILRKVGLEGICERYPKELSGGQKQRVAIARTLFKDSSLILADEPTGALDTENGKQVMEILKKLSYEKLVVVVSHNTALSEEYADRIIELKDGRIVSDETLTMDADTKRRIVQQEGKISVKKGIKLDYDEMRQIQDAIEKGDEINTVENINLLRMPTPKLVAPKYEKKPIFKKTRLAISKCFKLISNIFRNKIARLAITVVLCSISFSVFGIFNSMSVYDENRLVTNALKETDTPSILASVQVKEPSGDQYNINVNNQFAKSVEEKTQFKTKAAYNSYYVGTTQPAGFNNNTKGNKYYYYKAVRGAVEFTPDEINQYGFEIVHGSYPKEFDEIMVTEYYAQCMVNWQYQYYIDGGIKKLEKVNDLVDDSVTITIGYTASKKEYKISGIVKTGTIPQKYDDLKEDFDNKSTVLKNDYLNYLNNSFMLYHFVKPGFAENCMQKYDALPTYSASTYNYFFDTITDQRFLPTEEVKKEEPVKTDIDYSNYKSKFLAKEELDSYYTEYDDETHEIKSQRFFYFDNICKDTEDPEFTPKTSLGKHEVLVDGLEFTKMYSNEINTMLDLFGKNPTGPNKDEFDAICEDIDIMTTTKDKSVFTIKLADLIERLTKTYHRWSKRDKNLKGAEWLKKDSTFKKYVLLNANTTSEIKLDDPNYKIVGIYYNIQSNASDSILMNKADLNELGLNLDQGIYSYLICTNNGNGNFKKLADMFKIQTGTMLECQSSAIALVKINREFFEQLSTLFLIVSGVFALFSIIMFANFIASSIHSKKGEIGILRCLGARGIDIFKMFLIETLIISTINAAIASGLSFLGSMFVNMFVKQQMNLFINIANMTWSQILIMFGISYAVGVLAAITPIIRISYQKPIEAVRTAE